MRKQKSALFQDITDIRDVPTHLELCTVHKVKQITIRRIGFQRLEELPGIALRERMERFGKHWDGMVERSTEEAEKEERRIEAAKAKAAADGVPFVDTDAPDDREVAYAKYPHDKTLRCGLVKLDEHRMEQHEFDELGSVVDRDSAKWAILEILDFNGCIGEDNDDDADAGETDTETKPD